MEQWWDVGCLLHKLSQGGEEGFANKDLGYGWDFCGKSGNFGKPPYDCTYGKIMSSNCIPKLLMKIKMMFIWHV